MTAAQDLREIADEIDDWDPFGSKRLHELADGLDSNDKDPWIGLDLVSTLDIDTIVERAANRDSKPTRTSNLERFRNVLVLVPIFVTWAGLAWAANAYVSAISANQSLAERPFLLLWEQGFDGHGLGGPQLRVPLSLVATIDAIVIFLIAGLTWVVHSQTSVASAAHHARTQDLEDRLNDAIWNSTLELRKRGSLSGAIDRFGRGAKKLTDEMRAEREHLEELVNGRERRMNQLSGFAADFGTAAAAMTISAANMADKITGSMQANKTLADLVAQLAQAQSNLEAQLAAIALAMGSSSDGIRGAAVEVAAAAVTVSEAAESVGPANASMADSTKHLHLEIAQLRQQLEDDQTVRRAGDDALVREMIAAADSLREASNQHRSAAAELAAELTRFRRNFESADSRTDRVS